MRAPGWERSGRTASGLKNHLRAPCRPNHCPYNCPIRYISEVVFYSGTALSASDAAALWSARIGASSPDVAFASPAFTANAGLLSAAAPTVSGSATVSPGVARFTSATDGVCVTSVPVSGGDTTVALWVQVSPTQGTAAGTGQNVWALGLGSTACSSTGMFSSGPFNYFTGVFLSPFSGVDYHLFPNAWWITGAPATVTPNTWVHLALTVPRSAGVATSYAGGAAVATQAGSSFNPGSYTTATLWLGQVPSWSGWVGFAGCADSVFEIGSEPARIPAPPAGR